jgi:hypothetical protein
LFSKKISNKNYSQNRYFLSLYPQATSSKNANEGHADRIAQELKRMAEDDINIEYRRNTVSSRRKTIHEITENSQKRSKMIGGNFKSLFLRMLRDPNASGIIVINLTYIMFLCGICHTFRILYFIILFEHFLYILLGLSRRMSSQVLKNAFSAFERRRSTILSEKRRTQTQRPYDIYDDADNLRRVSNGRIFYPQPRQTNVTQFQYDNPTFKQDENI